MNFEDESQLAGVLSHELAHSEINKSGTTVLVVTHNKELVNEMGKRVILIEDGHIEQDEIRGSYDI